MTPEERFAGCLRFPTVSSRDGFPLDPFLEMHDYSRRQWPLVFSRMEPLVLGGASLLFRWDGTDTALEPLLLTAHQDVVPADAGDGWEHHPFHGVIAGGRVHGRGSIDYKCGYAGILEACENLLNLGFKPRRTVLVAMGHDEETGGAAGAGEIVRHLAGLGVRCAMAIDEGGYLHRLPWSSGSAALVGIAEKGYATFSVRARAEQGHASVPPPVTVAGLLARAVIKLSEHPFPLNPPAGIMALFHGVPLEEAAATPFGSSLLRTTAAVTVMGAGCKENVLPATGEMLVNCRVIPGESTGGVLERLRETLEPAGVEVKLLKNESLSEPSAVSSVECREYHAVREAAGKFSGGLPVLPSIFAAATDSRHYSKISRQVYRFLPVNLDQRGVGMLHSTGESVSIRDYLRCVGFYRELVTGY